VHPRQVLARQQRVRQTKLKPERHYRRLYPSRPYCHPGHRHRSIATSGDSAVPGRLLSMVLERPFFINHRVVPCCAQICFPHLNPISNNLPKLHRRPAFRKRVSQALSIGARSNASTQDPSHVFVPRTLKCINQGEPRTCAWISSVGTPATPTETSSTL
jgi:hypothetical protein